MRSPNRAGVLPRPVQSLRKPIRRKVRGHQERQEDEEDEEEASPDLAEITAQSEFRNVHLEVASTIFTGTESQMSQSQASTHFTAEDSQEEEDSQEPQDVRREEEQVPQEEEVEEEEQEQEEPVPPQVEPDGEQRRRAKYDLVMKLTLNPSVRFSDRDAESRKQLVEAFKLIWRDLSGGEDYELLGEVLGVAPKNLRNIIINCQEIGKNGNPSAEVEENGAGAVDRVDENQEFSTPNGKQPPETSGKPPTRRKKERRRDSPDQIDSARKRLKLEEEVEVDDGLAKAKADSVQRWLEGQANMGAGGDDEELPDPKAPSVSGCNDDDAASTLSISLLAELELEDEENYSNNRQTMGSFKHATADDVSRFTSGTNATKLSNDEGSAPLVPPVVEEDLQKMQRGLLAKGNSDGDLPDLLKEEDACPKKNPTGRSRSHGNKCIDEHLAVPGSSRGFEVPGSREAAHLFDEELPDIPENKAFVTNKGEHGDAEVSGLDVSICAEPKEEDDEGDKVCPTQPTSRRPGSSYPFLDALRERHPVRFPEEGDDKKLISQLVLVESVMDSRPCYCGEWPCPDFDKKAEDDFIDEETEKWPMFKLRCKGVPEEIFLDRKCFDKLKSHHPTSEVAKLMLRGCVPSLSHGATSATVDGLFFEFLRNEGKGKRLFKFIKKKHNGEWTKRLVGFQVHPDHGTSFRQRTDKNKTIEAEFSLDNPSDPPSLRIGKLYQVMFRVRCSVPDNLPDVAQPSPNFTMHILKSKLDDKETGEQQSLHKFFSVTQND